MLERMKRKIKPYPQRYRPESSFIVPFDEDGVAAVFFHAHDENGEHTLCGPVIFDSQTALRRFRLVDPKRSAAIAAAPRQPPEHILAWFESGLRCMYFAFAAPNDGLYMVRLREPEATLLLLGKVPRNTYFTAENRLTSEYLQKLFEKHGEDESPSTDEFLRGEVDLPPSVPAPSLPSEVVATFGPRPIAPESSSEDDLYGLSDLARREALD